MCIEEDRFDSLLKNYGRGIGDCLLQREDLFDPFFDVGVCVCVCTWECVCLRVHTYAHVYVCACECVHVCVCVGKGRLAVWQTPLVIVGFVVSSLLGSIWTIG